MRIAEVSPPWLAVPPSGYGGIEWVVALVADGLVERGHDVTLLATGDSRTKAKLEYVFETAPGPKFINSIWHDTLHSLHVYREMSRFDIIHEHTVWSGLVAATLVDVPVVHTLHGPFNPEMRQLYERVADRIWFVAISESQRSHMPELRYGGVVYNGIDTSLYPLRTEKEDFVLFLGRVTPDKGPVRAVEAARAAGVPLVMALKIASPEEEDYWKHEVEPRLPEGTTVLPEIPLEKKVDLLSRARAVLFPIDWEEPFGLVMTEAMACGTPVIATPRGSVPEVVADGETGFIVPVESYAEAAAEAMQRLGDIDAGACRARVEEGFSKESMVAGYEAVFERALER
ncbi:MAG TPA: glycosyltransferase family 4 protein [Actinomycetota bacterium]|jgi:glycosyltransferase involved in cell wall biosynthesis|nr:glycosyltransferase family 4 protein [Actinomycetota bacterium]